MAFDVVMPQMGESIAEATVLKWHKQVGDVIAKDDTLYEISTDKVDAEIPAPAAGTLIEILVDVNATVPVGTVVARIGDASEKPAGAASPSAASPPAAVAASGPAAVAPAFAVGERMKVEPMSRMRKTIAENMVASRRTSAHVYTVFEIDMTHVAQLRNKHKQAFESQFDTKLSFLPYVMMAVCKALRAYPVANTSIDGDNVIYKQDINLGIAVSLDWGLIVPVVKNADMMNLGGLARSLNDLAGRARSKQLKPDEISGGTFTITNPGVYGDTFGLPIINQPQVAILGVGAIVKRPVVITGPDGTDFIAIRQMMFSSLGFDHRIIDGAIGDLFMAFVKKELETSTFGLE
jgi:2-oxoglutarate dehydrogenase E2 component (dihydrolipoamide succinyltransferase)